MKGDNKKLYKLQLELINLGMNSAYSISIEEASRYPSMYCFVDGESFLSQHYDSPISDGRLEFFGAEQFMMFNKAQQFGDNLAMIEVLKVKTPLECQEIGRNVTNFNKEWWVKIRERIVYEGNYLKFTQNEDLRDRLLNETSGKLLVEAYCDDLIWSAGHNEEDLDINNIHNWRGQNLMGRILTKLREDLIKL